MTIKKAAPAAQPSAAPAAALDRIETDIRDGTVIIGSDFHYGHGEPASTAHRALVRLTGDLRPDLIIANGDVCDFPAISRHGRIGFEQRPRIVDEILEAQARLGEIAAAAPEAALVWNVGNHDIRLMSRIAERAAELEGLRGTCLSHHFPEWQFAWAMTLNPDAALPVNIQHRLAGGATAAARNVAKLSTHCVTSHTHFAGIASKTGWHGTVHGVDTGCVASVQSRAFRQYTECAPTGWRSGFAVLRLEGGELLPPDLATVTAESAILGEGCVCFRGRTLRV